MNDQLTLLRTDRRPVVGRREKPSPPTYAKGCANCPESCKQPGTVTVDRCPKRVA